MRLEPIPQAALTAREAARFYRSLGYSPIPSSRSTGHPVLPYRDYWERPFPEEAWHATFASNVQLTCGAAWGLVVVDLDGPGAISLWSDWSGDSPFTWAVRTGSGGLHLYFAVPRDEPCPGRLLWAAWDRDLGRWKRHTRIDFLGDRCLVKAPPSVHKNGRPYEWLPGRSPRDMPSPAPLPEWVRRLPTCTAPTGGCPCPGPASHGEKSWSAPRRSSSVAGGRSPLAPLLRYRIDDVDYVLGTRKPDVAREWGLRIVSARASRHGWLSCRAIEREDRHPSAGLHAARGTFRDNSTGQVVYFYDLAVVLGRASTWVEAVNELGDRYGAIPRQRRLG